MVKIRFPDTSSLAKPNGNSEDWRYVTAGKQLSLSQVRTLETALKKDPNNLSLRLQIIGFYGTDAIYQKQFARQVLWMIENRPNDCISFYLAGGIAQYRCNWSKHFIDQASEKWDQHTKKGANAISLCNAASFFEYLDWKKSENLYKRANKADPDLALPSRRLAYNYRFLAKTSKNQKKLIAKALTVAEHSINCRKEHPGERIGMYVEFTPTAIIFDDLKLARKFANRLKARANFYLWEQYACLFLAWIDFKEQKRRSLKFRMQVLKKLLHKNQAHVASSFPAVSFLEDIIKKDEIELAKQLLKILISGSKSKAKEHDELKEWLNALTSNRKPKLNRLQIKLNRFF